MSKSRQASIISFAKDLPNIISLLGLLCAVFGIFFAIKGYFLAAIIGVLWAVLFDWLDGMIARKMKNRTKEQGVFGGQLDSMIDIVSFGVFPAILLLSYGNFSVWFMPGAFFIIAACAIRLSYFNIFGLIDSKTYMGLAVDNTGLLLSFLFLFESFFSHNTFSIILYIIIILLAGLNLSPIHTPKFDKKWVYAIAAYVIGMTIFFSWILLDRA